MDATEVSTATKQAVNGRDENGRFAAGNTPSTGFHTNPERRKNGKWDKDESISYWYNKLLRMPNEEFDIFEPANRTQRIAHARIVTACGTDEHALRATKEITDRTEGRPQQGIDMSFSSASAADMQSRIHTEVQRWKAVAAKTGNYAN